MTISIVELIAHVEQIDDADWECVLESEEFWMKAYRKLALNILAQYGHTFTP